jgi:hypothetical protein
VPPRSGVQAVEGPEHECTELEHVQPARGPKRAQLAQIPELDDLELTSVAKVIAMSTPKEYIAYHKRVKGLA